MRAIDLYAGMGGWSLGLRLAGVEVVESYEWWRPAIETHNANHDGHLTSTDVRKLKLDALPGDIELVVGSPPCTEFSYSNRGGGGDLAEGLKDLVKFLEIVDYLKPRWWALENVPRVAEVLTQGLKTAGHPLYRFRHLEPTIEIVDFSDYGTPQSRRRCIAGNLPFDLVKAYGRRLPRKTLGDVVLAMATPGEVIDPVWGVALPAKALTEMEAEPALNGEELRMNRESKTYHPVYNNMAFPDVLQAPARTVTATCTRVSRESIVIETPDRPGGYRRLTIRERASLQGFPITYQFFARSFAEKARMVGNAIPPTFTYLLAQAAQQVDPASLPTFVEAGVGLHLPEATAPLTSPNVEGRLYPAARSFRAALPGLRFKSGMRFELANVRDEATTRWEIRFRFGPSRDVREIELDDDLSRQLDRSAFVRSARLQMGRSFLDAREQLFSSDPDSVQRAWTRRGDGLRPYEIVDRLGALAQEFQDLLEQAPSDIRHAAIGYVLEAAAEGEVSETIPGARKLANNASAILAGLVVGSWFNTLDWHVRRSAAA